MELYAITMLATRRPHSLLIAVHNRFLRLGSIPRVWAYNPVQQIQYLRDLSHFRCNSKLPSRGKYLSLNEIQLSGLTMAIGTADVVVCSKPTEVAALAN
jgi:hypothetical protein